MVKSIDMTHLVNISFCADDVEPQICCGIYVELFLDFLVPVITQPSKTI